MKEHNMFSKKISLFVLPFMAMVSLQANDPFFNDPFGDDIFKEMYQMQKEMDKVFERMQERMQQRTQLMTYPTRQSFMPNRGITGSSLIVDKGTYYEYNTQIPENKNNQIDVNIENAVLYLKATIDTVQKSENANMKMQQHSMSMIQRSETLPPDADVSTLKGEYQKGIFVLTLQKQKNLTHPEVKKKEPVQAPKSEQIKEKETLQPPKVEKVEEQEPLQTPKVEEVNEKDTNNTGMIKIKVPHTTSNA